MTNKNPQANKYALGNFTKHAVENFEENIIHQHNYLEKINSTINNTKDK